jgi:hypothetical protein
MKTECIKNVEKAIGRPLGNGEATRIEERLVANLRELARTDEKFHSMSQAERLRAAAKLSLDRDIQAAQKAAQRRASNLMAQARESAHQAQRAVELGGKTANHAALFERLRQVESYITGVKNELFSHLVDTVHASAPRFFGLVENAAAVEKFIREVFGEDTGDAFSKKAAKAYLDTMEEVRTRENAAGADIGQLDYAYLPQPHDTGAIVKAGKDRWVGKVLPLMDRERFVKEDGARMNDAELTTFLEAAFDTLSTEGLVRRAPSAGGRGSRASRSDDAHRVLHFKDADSYLAYIREFGAGSPFEAIHNHVNAHAKNIALMEAFGANPTATYQLLRERAEIEDSRTAGEPVRGVMEYFATPDMIWDTLNGTTQTPVNPRGAAIGRSIRNWISAGKLQGIMLASINDAPMWLATAKYNGVPLGRALREFFAAVSSSKVVDDAARLGLAMESMTGEMQTWHADNMRQDWWNGGKVANATMRLGLVESWTQRLRAGLGLMLQDHLATMTGTDWGSLSKFDRDRMQAGGVSARDWAIWQAAKPENIRGRRLLTANAIREVEGFTDAEINHAVGQMLGFIDNEAKTAVLAPDVVTRAAITQGARAGTFGGELGRSVMLFKSFPLAMVIRNLERIRSLPTVQGRVAYSMTMLTALTLMGALSLELKDLVAGRNPRDATTPKFWGAAFAQGGGLGIFGDVLYTGLGGNSRAGNPNWTNLGGPVLGTAADLANVTLGNIGEKLQGKKTHAGAEILRFARSNTPFLNLWYLKAGIDHMGFNDLQETLSPGYLARQRAAARRDWGTTYWWEPNKMEPTQFPEFASAIGE